MSGRPNASITPLFNRASKGERLAPVDVSIDRSQVRQFAAVLGETDPVYFGVDAARAAGFRDLVAPPSFFMVVEAAADRERARRGSPLLLQLIGCDFRYLLHGDERYTYFGPLCAGDTVAVSSTVLDFYEKKGGLMEFVTIASEVTHPDHGVLIRGDRTLLHKLG